MDHNMYWMWPKRKLTGGSYAHAPTTTSYHDSWEEQAFAEDSAAGALGGCIWPPRSYTCSFCRREFRSAQALGGHMNVHRRDRARLKQSPNTHQDLSNPNPNGAVAPLSPCGVSATSTTQENCCEQAFFSPLLALSDQDLGALGLKRGRQNSRIEEIGCRAQIACVGMDSTVKSSYMAMRWSPEIDDEQQEAIVCKRRKRDEALNLFIKSDTCESRRSDALLPFFIQTSLGERHHLQSEVLGIRVSPMDDLDLELRLGDPPKVK